jgi:hypothetical protein
MPTLAEHGDRLPRIWLKLHERAESLALETLLVGELYEEATRDRGASHHSGRGRLVSDLLIAKKFSAWLEEWFAFPEIVKGPGIQSPGLSTAALDGLVYGCA